MKSRDNFNVTTSLRKNLVRRRKNGNPFEFYDVLEKLGEGSMGSVMRVKKKKHRVGGSSRKNNQKKECTWLPGKLSELLKCCTNGNEPIKNEPVLLIDPKLSGSFDSSSVQLSTHSIPAPSGNYEIYYALKTINLSKINNKKFIDELKNEIDIMRSLDHPNIVRAIETFDYRKQLYIVMEVCSGGNLFNRDPYTEEQACRIVSDITSAVAYMHRYNVIHRDLKYENIMFENNKPDAKVKIIDFGLSRKYKVDGPVIKDQVGTIYTMAPEVLQGHYTSKADVWSIGVIAFMLLCSEMPFYGKHRRQVAQNIMYGHYDMSASIWKNISMDAKEFVISLLVRNPGKRPTAHKCQKLEWLRKGRDDLKSSRRSRVKPIKVFMHTYLSESSGSGSNSGSFSSDINTSIDTELFEPTPQINDIFESLRKYASYSKLSRLALLIIAFKSTSEEVGDLHTLFKEYDLDETGSLDLLEFKEVLSPTDASEEELEFIFSKVDMIGNGIIQYTEFLAATLEALGMIEEERLAEAFDRLDSDDSGYISSDNLNELFGGELSINSIKKMIREADFLNDERISYEEFLTLWSNEHQQE